MPPSQGHAPLLGTIAASPPRPSALSCLLNTSSRLHPDSRTQLLGLQLLLSLSLLNTSSAKAGRPVSQSLVCFAGSEHCLAYERCSVSVGGINGRVEKNGQQLQKGSGGLELRQTGSQQRSGLGPAHRVHLGTIIQLPAVPPVIRSGMTSSPL